jgi:uncharacterized protein (UPF0216 family)
VSRHLDKLIEHDIDTLNDHLPETRVSLRDLKDIPNPHFITRCGETSVFRREEIEEILRVVPEQFYDDIRLPVVILRRMDYGSGIHTVAGTKAELFLMHVFLGYVDLRWENFAVWKPIERLARPQVQLLRRKLPSTTVLGIVVGVTKEKKNEKD